MSSPTGTSTKLASSTATRWFRDKKGHLGRKQVGYVIEEDSRAPGLSTPPTAEEIKARNQWKRDNESACGIIWEDLTDEQKTKDNVVAAFDKNDAKGLWAALHKVARPTTISSRYLALADLIRLSMRNAETLEGFLGRVRAGAAEWRNLWPAGFTLEHAFFEFVLGAFLHGLSIERQPWSSNMLLQLKHGATLDAVESLCRLEDGNQSLHGNPAARAMASRTTPFVPTPVLALPQSGRKVSREDALAALHAVWGQSNCFICDGKHTSDKCTFIEIARNAAIAARKLRNQSQRSDQNDRRATANAAVVPGATITEVTEASVRHFVYSTLASLALRSRSDSDWNTDTGCSTHMTPHRSWFHTYTPLRVPVELADHSVIWSAGIGTVEFRPSLGGIEQPYTVFLDSVLHVPSLAVNLLSVYTLTTKRGFTMIASAEGVQFLRDGHLRMTASVDQHLTGYLDGTTVLVPGPVPRALLAAAPKRVALTPDLWHRRFGHLDPDTVRRMHRMKAVRGLHFEHTPADVLCEPCIVGKQKRAPINRAARPRASEPLAEVHWDLKGPLPRSRNGFLYWALGVDSHSRYKFVDFLKRKLEFHGTFVYYVEYAETQTGRRYKIHWHDKGGEFIGTHTVEFARGKGMEIRATETAAPWQNGLAERANGVIRDHIVSMLREAGLPESWWPFAVAAFVWVYNRSLIAGTDETPFERWFHEKPDVSRLRVFGCLAYALRWPERRDGPLDSHTRKSIFLGYSTEKVGCWVFYDLEDRTIFDCSTAVFVEDVFPGLHTFAGDVPDYENLFPAESTNADSLPQAHNNDDEDDRREDPDLPVSSAPSSSPSPSAAADADAPLPSPPISSLPVSPHAVDVPLPESPSRDSDPPAIETRSTPLSTLPFPLPTPSLVPVPPPSHSSLVQRTERPSPRMFYHEARDSVRVLPSRSSRPTTSLAEPSGRGVAELAARYLTHEEALDRAFASVVQYRAFSANAADYKEPKTYKEAMRREGGEADHWRAACREELNNLVRKGVYKIVTSYG